MLDHSFQTASYEGNEGYLLTRAEMRWFWDHYLDSPTAGKNPYASPLQARDVSGVPPGTVVTAGFDPLQDEGAAYGDRLAEAGVAVEHRLHEDMIHGFVPTLIEPELDAARDEIARFDETIRGL